MYAKKNVSVKVLVVLLCVVLLIGGAIGGTVAYLMTNTDPVTNTFTAGDVNITLVESPIKYADDGTVSYDKATTNVENSYRLIPGTEYKKDPVVTVETGSEACWLFVKIEEAEVNEIYLTYTLNLEGWTQLEVGSDVWYREVGRDADERSFHLIVGDTIAIKTSVTKENMDQAKTANLTITAYAVQRDNLGVEEAWDEVSNTQNS